MSEEDALNRARRLSNDGKADDATKLLWPLCESKNPITKLNATFVLLDTLNPVTENDQLLSLADKGIATASGIGHDDAKAYLLSKKVFYLLNRLSLLIARSKNLILSARIFRWIDFSLQRDKDEYDSIAKERVELEKIIDSTAAEVEALAEARVDHGLRGQLFEAIGQYYSTRLFMNLLDFQSGGRIRAKIFNLRFVRRWNLTYFLYDRESRKAIKQAKRRCFEYFERAIAEFEAADASVDVGRACYNFAAKLMLANHFARANRQLLKAKAVADRGDHKLMRQITELDQRIRERNRVVPNYVEELGLDMP